MSASNEHTDDPWLGRLRALETGQVSDVMGAAGLSGRVVAPSILPLQAGMRLCGRAACGRGGSGGAAKGDLFQAMARPGAIIVLEAGGFQEAALLGGFVVETFRQGGAAGLVTDGLIRDAAEIRETGLPVFSAGLTPAGAHGLWAMQEINIGIELPGVAGAPVRVETGDLVLADEDGIVVVPRAYEAQIIEDAEVLREAERRIGDEMRNGATRGEAFARHPRFSHVRRIRQEG
jgi:regulator of RNase E activity RraA